VSHEHQVFRNPPPATPAEVRAALARGDVSGALDAMVGSVLHGHGDWKELQELYLTLLEHHDPQVRTLAVTCLGHVAQVHRRLDERRVVAALRRYQSAAQGGASIANALDDIEIFLHPRRTRWRNRSSRVLRPWTWL
jgi:hypothetical protein